MPVGTGAHTHSARHANLGAGLNTNNRNVFVEYFSFPLGLIMSSESHLVFYFYPFVSHRPHTNAWHYNIPSRIPGRKSGSTVVHFFFFPHKQFTIALYDLISRAFSIDRVNYVSELIDFFFVLCNSLNIRAFLVNSITIIPVVLTLEDVIYTVLL